MNKTLGIIKPDATAKQFIGAILKMIEENGFKIIKLKKLNLSIERAKKFYKIHEEKTFYNDLVSYMTSGSIVAFHLEKENAVEDFRKLIGATDPKEAEEQTLRKAFGTNKEKNAVHGSDSDENATKEIMFFFKE